MLSSTCGPAIRMGFLTRFPVHILVSANWVQFNYTETWRPPVPNNQTRSEEREFYLRLRVKERWSTRQLERQLAGA